MDIKKIKKIFKRHFGEKICDFIINKSIKKEAETFDLLYNPPFSNKYRIIGSIFTTSNIRYGDFLEEVINEFLKENGANLVKSENSKYYDLFFEKNNKLYVGEIKIRDNHDSTKKVGQIENLILKAKIEKTSNKNREVIAIMNFISPFDKKNHNYYKNRLTDAVREKYFDDFKVFFGDELFHELGIIEEWNKTKKLIYTHNEEIRSSDGFIKIILNYIKENEEEDIFRKIEDYLK